MDGHLVAVEVGVERRADQRMQLDGAALHQHRLERLDAQTVQSRRPVEQHWVVVDHLFEDVPNLRPHALDEALGALDIVGKPLLDELAHDERLEELERHFLRQATLVQLELRADHDHRAARIVHTLAQQVLAEAALLALEHVRQALELVVAGTSHRAAAPPVIDQRVAGFLQHALLVTDDDLRRAQLQQPLEAVVAVDDTAVEIVQVAGGEASAVQLHHRAQVWRQHRQHREDHPLGAVAGLAEGLDHVQALRGLLAALAGRAVDLLAQLGGQLVQIDGGQQRLHRLSAHAGLEDFGQVWVGVAQPILEVLQLAILLLLQEIVALERFEVAPARLGLGANLVRVRHQLVLHRRDLALGVHARALYLALGISAGAIQLGARRLHDQVTVLLGHAVQMLHVRGVCHGALLGDALARRDVDGILGKDLAGVLAQQRAQVLLGVARLLQLLRAPQIELLALLLHAALQLGNARVAPLLHRLDSGGHRLFALLNLAGDPLFDARQRHLARLFVDVRDDVEREVENALEVTGREIEQEPDAARRTLEIPDVADR